MERWREQYLGIEAIPETLTEAEIAFFFRLDEDSLQVVTSRRRPMTRLGLVLHIGFLRMSGRHLSALERVPSSVLAFAGDEVGVAAPQLATLRAIYRRRMTLFAHQRLAASATGISAANEAQLRMLTAYLRRQAETVLVREQLVTAARRWLYDHAFLIPTDRSLEQIAARAQEYALGELKNAIEASAGSDTVAGWTVKLSAVGPNPDQALLDWLRASPKGSGARAIGDVQKRIAVLHALGAERLILPEVPIERIRQHAIRISRRKASTLPRLNEPRRTVEIGCWLRLHLLEMTDVVLMQTSRRIGQLWSDARRKVEERALEQLNQYRTGVDTIISALDDYDLSDREFRERVSKAVLPLRSAPATRGKVQAIRNQMATTPGPLRLLLKQADAICLTIAPDHPLSVAMHTLRNAYNGRELGLMPWQIEPFLKNPPAALRAARTASDRLAAYEVATAMLLKRSLRNGSVSAPHSAHHRSVADQLMPTLQWHKLRPQAVRDNRWAGSIDAYLGRFREALSLRATMLDDAIGAADVGIVNGRFLVPKLRALPTDPATDSTRTALFAAIGAVQLPEIIVAVDARTGFSSLLLGREATGADELQALYAAILALGTDKTAAEMARMVDGVSDDRIELAMRAMEDNGHLRAASDAVAAEMLATPLAVHWGSGVAASADMMSLDATRRLWLSRIEPRRRVPAIGTYTHISDRWAVIYDQPVLLNERQAGVAIEGALKQNIIAIQRLAVDTHGFTHFAMAAAKLLGFDLAPRLADLASRKLFLPHDVSVPASLEPMVERVGVSRAAREGWDGLLHLILSLKNGHGSAATIIARHGSAAKGMPVYEAGTLLGKVLRSLFLLDYLVKPVFRREVHRVLGQGESVHQLQRAIFAGRIEAKHARNLREVAATSGALTLLTNIVMAWNTAAMQKVVDREGADRFPAEHLGHIAPVAFRHINMHGKLHFPIEHYAGVAVAGRRQA